MYDHSVVDVHRWSVAVLLALDQTNSLKPCPSSRCECVCVRRAPMFVKTDLPASAYPHYWSVCVIHLVSKLIMPKSGVCEKSICCSFAHLCPLPFAGVSVCECVFSLCKCVCEGGRCANVKHVWRCLCVNLPRVCLDYANDGDRQVFVWADVCLVGVQSRRS